MAMLGDSFLHQTVIFNPWLRPPDLFLSSIHYRYYSYYY